MFRLLPIFFLLVLTSVNVFSHSHSNEAPHLKYTREVNEAALRNEDDVYLKDHGHSHGKGGCNHAHNHQDDDDDHHGHSHETHHHGHSHETHHHGHSHETHHHGHSHENTQKQSAQPKKRSAEYTYDKNGMFNFLNDARTRLWVYAIGSTLLISAFPCFILAFIPIRSDINEDSALLKILLAFGAGGLLGDAFLHLIPHATPSKGDSHSHSHSHTHSHEGSGHSHEPHDMSVGQWVLTGFMVFFIVEKFVRILRGEDSHHGHGHSHSHGPRPLPVESKAKKSDVSDEATEENDSDAQVSSPKKNKKKDKKTACTKENNSSEVVPVPRIRVAAYLNLVADLMHNFTDGLAIGASFIAGTTIGLVTMVTVLVHEVPHEIGDFAILVQSGCSKKKAMLIQLCTAMGALLGCCISLWSVDAYALAEAAEQSWILPFTAGGFIYIATVSVIPELLERSTFWQSVREVLAIIFGVFLMYLIAFYE